MRLQSAGVALGGLLVLGLTGCSLVGVPGLFLNSRSIYTASPVVIPYTFNGPGNAAWCRYTLYRQQPTSQYLPAGSPVTRELSSSGNLVVDVAATTGSSVPDGNYSLSFGVLGGSSSENLIPTLAQTVQFSVQTGPYIQSTSPLVASAGTASLTLYGWNLSGSSVTVSSSNGTAISVSNPPSSISSTQLVVSTLMTAGSGGAFLQANIGSATSPQYFVPIEQGTISFTSVTPSFGSVRSSPLQVIVQGINFTPYTSIDFLDAAGNAVPFTATSFSGGSASNAFASYFILSVDLSHAAQGSGSITLNPNDGSGLVVPSPAASFYIGG